MIVMILMMMTLIMMMTHLMNDSQFPGQMVQTVCSQAWLHNTLQLREDLPEVTG